MLLCLAVTIGFRDTKRMGNAAGNSIFLCNNFELFNPIASQNFDYIDGQY